jgi:cyclic beta-1,2-glucan synthetase
LPVAPRAVAANVAHLAELGMAGRYGLYEAADFGPPAARLRRPAVVTSYMSHHQGMILAALANCLCGDSLVRRFHADPRIATVELLLNERLPPAVPEREPLGTVEAAAAPLRTEQAMAGIWPAPERGGRQERQILSNGRLSVLVTSRGGGSSRLTGRVLVRGQTDAALEPRGTVLYLEDLARGEVWPVFGEGCEAHFAPHLAELQAHGHDLALRSTVAVAPVDDLEVRLVRLVNRGSRPRRLALTSYGEVVLASPAEDRRHPVFASLFVQSAWNEERRALVFHRRTRSPNEEPIALAHTVVAGGRVIDSVSWETDRGRFLGRAGGYGRPAALTVGGAELSGTTGTTLDSIFALRVRFDLPAGAEREVAFLTAAGRSRREALAVLGRHPSLSRVQAVLEQARLHALPLLHEVGLEPGAARQAQQLLSALLAGHPVLRAEPEVIAANRRGQPALWPFGISGDRPILLVRIRRGEDASLVRELLAVHAWWRRHRIEADLVILDEAATVYNQPVAEWLDREIVQRGEADWRNRPGGIFVLQASGLSEEDRGLLAAVAVVVLDASQGGLAEQLTRLRSLAPSERLPPFVPSPSSPPAAEPTAPVERPADLRCDNGFGGFTAGGREYVIHLEPGSATPAPWINVLANPGFGTMASESGGGCTWAVNSGENRLTPWRNDPVTDAPSEVLYLRDEETGAVWTVTRRPAGIDQVCQARHGAGFTTYLQNSHGLEQELRLSVPVAAPVKIVELVLTNRWPRPRRITATYYADLVLGTSRRATAPHVVSEFAAECGAVLARCPYPEGGERTAFLASDRAPHGLTADRIEFLGQPADWEKPAGLVRIGLMSTVGAGLDPCAALQIHLDLQAGQTVRACFLFGEGSDRDEAVALATRFRRLETVAAARREVEDFWSSILDRVQIETPEPEIDLPVNRWLLYQALSCRLWGRSALYQSSGAFGFRDQLQDVLALLDAAPGIARAHLVEAARHQFEAGDVLHWWHPPDSRGVRTRCSDDLLWLPYVTARYVAVTGDHSVLDEQIPFREGPAVPAGEAERYDRYPLTELTASLYEHCLLAIRRGDTLGPHGLPLLGTCDWNDGMNRVGAGGKGESVWLAWFLSAVLRDFAPLSEQRGESSRGEAFRRRAEAVRRAVEESAWDGDWYLRAFYDDGTPLGAAGRRECEIDLIAQTWAVLAEGDPERAARAMESAWQRLVSPEEGLTRLLAPPFDRGPKDPGYIKAYPPGVRENGGKYSHAAVWAAWAFARLGDGDRAVSVLRTILPTYHSATPDAALRYRVEPYAVAADIAGVPPHTGRGGWTWYTGTAGWTYRLVIEAILGLRRKPGFLEIDPCLPRDWPGYSAVLREGGATYRVRVDNAEGAGRGVAAITLDGELIEGREVRLVDDGGEHQIVVRLGALEKIQTVGVLES